MIVKGLKYHVRQFLLSQDDRPCIDVDLLVVTARPLDWRLIVAKLCGKRTARYWTGNDAWRYDRHWIYRVRAKITNWFVDKHYFLAEHLKVRDLRGVVRSIRTELELLPAPEMWEKVILWYGAPPEHRYGHDVIAWLKQDFPRFLFFRIPPAAFNIAEMQFLMTIADGMIRPSRWDGDPWLVREAVKYQLPVVSSFSNLSEVMKCDPDNYEELTEIIREVWKSS